MKRQIFWRRGRCLHGWLKDQAQTTESELWRNAGPSALQLLVTMLKSDKIWCVYLVTNCVKLRTFWTNLEHILIFKIRQRGPPTDHSSVPPTFNWHLLCAIRTVTLGLRTFYSSGPESWNTLPTELRHPDLTLGVFKRQFNSIQFNLMCKICCQNAAGQ